MGKCSFGVICYVPFQGFDEYMNLVLDDAEEVHLKTKKRRPLGMYSLKYGYVDFCE